MRIRTVIAVASLLLPLGAGAQIGPVGAEFQVNSYTMTDQSLPTMAAGVDGSFVVAWQSLGDGLGLGVFAQRFNSVGQTLGTEFQVNSYTFSHQREPKVAAGADGAFVVVWSTEFLDGSETGVFGQRYNSDGQAAGTEFQVNSHTTGYQLHLAVTAAMDGAFVVAWESFGQDNVYGQSSVFGQRFNSAGQRLGTEFLVNSNTPGFQRYPGVAAGADGAFVVVWQSEDGSFAGVFARRFDSLGQPMGVDFPVNSYTAYDQRYPAVTAGADGTFVVTWAYVDFNIGGVFGQQFNSAGQAVGTEFQANVFTLNLVYRPAVMVAIDGDFVVTWSHIGEIVGQRYNSLGQAAGADFQVNTFTPGVGNRPTIAAGVDGAFVVAWQSARDGSGLGVFAQRLTVLPDASCPAAPSESCVTSGKALLQLKLSNADTKDKINWRFIGGPLLTQASFGNPTTTASYALCLYDDGALKAELQVGPSDTLWVPVGSRGYKYTDAAGSSDGVTKTNLLGGDADKSKLLLKGKGTILPMPTPVSGTRFFAQTSAVTAQLREANGDCYATTFTDADTVKNTGTQYKAKK